MNLTIKLLKIIGSPFCSEDPGILPNDIEEARELYEFAKKNKIALTYLKALNKKNKLQYFDLLDHYATESDKYVNQSRTIIRISELFNNNNVDYAIFKSVMPFPTVPNDVDIIHFGTDIEFVKIGELMIRSGYQEVIGTADTQQRMFHDMISGGVLDPHPKKKDVFDIDIYQKVSASQLIYLDKKILEKYKTVDLFQEDHRIQSLSPEAELMAIIIHSIFPELLCTLFVYYSTLYHVYKMDDDSILMFEKIVTENNVKRATRAHFSIIAELHKEAHGFVPDKIDRICMLLGKEETEKKLLIKNGFNTPHKYSTSCFFKVFIEKFHDREFRKSVPKQIVFSLNPKNLKWILYNLIWRYRRDTY